MAALGTGAVRRVAASAFALLSAFMLVWILVGPAGARVFQARLDAREASVRRDALRGQRDASALAFRREAVTVPASVILKHYDHPAVLATHHLGAVLWTVGGLAQFGLQLDRTRPSHALRHRVVGYVFVAGVCLLTAGLALILAWDLRADRDFEAAFPEDCERPPLASEVAGTASVGAIQLWFLASVAAAVRAARRGQFAQHRRWIVRHVGAGLWVSLMRLAVLPLSAALTAATGRALHGGEKRDLFGTTAALSVVLCVCAAEGYLAVVPGDKHRVPRAGKSVASAPPPPPVRPALKSD